MFNRTCLKCKAECCKFVKIPSDENWNEKYCKDRGIEKTEFFMNFDGKKTLLYRYKIPSVCPHLRTSKYKIVSFFKSIFLKQYQDNLCKIQNNKSNPCKEFKCEKIYEERGKE